MPKLTSHVEDIESVPENRRSLYVENPDSDVGGYVLNPDEFEIEDPRKLKGALQKERERARQLARFRQAAGLGEDDDLDAVAELVKKSKQAGERGDKRQKQQADDEIDRLLAKREKEIRDELAPELTKVEKLARENEELRIAAHFDKAFGDARGHATALEDARAAAMRFLKLENGKVVVLDEDGDPTSKTLAQFVAGRFKEIKPHFFQATGSSGGDVDPGATRRTHAPTGGTDTRSPAQKITAGLAKRNAGR